MVPSPLISGAEEARYERDLPAYVRDRVLELPANGGGAGRGKSELDEDTPIGWIDEETSKRVSVREGERDGD